MTGRTISHYQILEVIGEGGMGIVYKARDAILGRFLAIKVLRPEALSQPDRRRRFLNEARAASALNHPNIVTIYEIGHDDGIDFIAMELVDGAPLNVRLKDGPIPIADATGYAAGVARALSAAHELGIIHRDIKPANILITRDNRAKVLDFGLAKLTEPLSPGSGEAETRTEATRPGMVLGTAAYMSPEQAEGKAVDQRSDIFSLGIVLFEMLTGKRPFKGDSYLSTLLSILKDPIPDLAGIRAAVPASLDSIVHRALEKSTDARFQSAADIAAALDAASIKPAPRYRRVAAAVAVIALLGAAGWWFHQQRQTDWARTAAIPEARRLSDQGKTTAAYDLAEQAERIVPDDPELKSLWNDVARNVNLDSTPTGAKVWRKDFTEPESAFRFMGVTPLKNFRTARGFYHLKFEKEGFSTSNDVAPALYVDLNFLLAPKADVPEGMALVPPSPAYTPTLGPIGALVLTGLGHFFVDRYEVTNKQFKAFVESGGYSKPEYWKEQFAEGSATLSFEQAMSRFRDSTGRPGPASWVGGSYAEGRDDYPVSGVSWFEAAAYAEFAGKKLLTLHHWFRVADPRISMLVAPVSNIGGKQAAKVGQFPNGAPFGAWDLVGNVKEWVYNEAGGGLRFIEGGAANEFAYQANAIDALSPWDRSLTNGFRCARYPQPLKAEYLRPRTGQARDFSKEKPVNDDIFAAVTRFYACDPRDLEASVDSVDDSPEGWRKERISYRACYGEERVFAYLFTPKDTRPPYQCVLYQPGSDSYVTPSSASLQGFGRVDFIIRGGRAVLWPVAKGTYERRYAGPSGSPTEARDRVIKVIQDQHRSVDYLQTRPEIDHDRIAYAGTSAGAVFGVIAAALDPRFRTALLLDGGIFGRAAIPETDLLNFAPRVKVPTLMINGRYDYTFPYETSQKPLFRFLGTPEKDKRHVLFDSAHDISLFRTDLIREVLAWLDRYLGPVKK